MINKDRGLIKRLGQLRTDGHRRPPSAACPGNGFVFRFPRSTPASARFALADSFARCGVCSALRQSEHIQRVMMRKDKPFASKSPTLKTLVLRAQRATWQPRILYYVSLITIALHSAADRLLRPAPASSILCAVEFEGVW